MQGFAILLAFHFAGLLLRYYLHIPLPANVIGLLLFAAALFAGLIKLEQVEQSAQFLLRHMMLFFAPFLVGTIAFFPVLAEQAVGIGLSLIAGTCIVLVVTGKVTEWLSRKEIHSDERSRMVE